jgi:hypothetical protein
VDTKMVFEALPKLWPIALAVIVAGAATAWSGHSTRLRLWSCTALAITAASLGMAQFEFPLAGNSPTYLYDAVAVVVASAFPVVACVASGSYLRSRNRGAVSVAFRSALVGALALFYVPVILFLIHCTCGDCL